MKPNVVSTQGTNQYQQNGYVFLPKTPEQFGYDADGNLTQDGRWYYTWDAENRLTQVESLSSSPTASKRKVVWEYDGKGRRIRQTTYNGSSGSYVVTEDLKFVYDGWHCLAELNATNNSLVRSYTWGLDLSGSLGGAGGVGGLLMMNSGTNGTHFYAYDGNGNVVALVKATDGTVSQNCEYDPFGAIIRNTGLMADENSFRFSTKRHNDTCDIDLYEHRPLRDGRFLSRDPIGERGGANLNAFVANDLVNKVDILGLAEGYFIVGYHPAILYGKDARMRGLSDGTEVKGLSVRYIPLKCSTCKRENIVIVQAIQRREHWIPGYNPPHFDYDPDVYSGNLPPEYTGPHIGNLMIIDSPWVRWFFGASWRIEDCALCRDGHRPEQILGCIRFMWVTPDDNSYGVGAVLDHEGPYVAEDPTSLWNSALARWNSTHNQ